MRINVNRKVYNAAKNVSATPHDMREKLVRKQARICMQAYDTLYSFKVLNGNRILINKSVKNSNTIAIYVFLHCAYI